MIPLSFRSNLAGRYLEHLPMEYVHVFLLLNNGLLTLWGILFICTQIMVMVDDEQNNCFNLRSEKLIYKIKFTVCMAQNLPTHRWIKIILGSHSAFCKWLPNEIPLRVVFSIVQHEGVIIFKRKSAPGILKTCNLSIGTTFRPIHLMTLSL